MDKSLSHKFTATAGICIASLSKEHFTRAKRKKEVNPIFKQVQFSSGCKQTQISIFSWHGHIWACIAGSQDCSLWSLGDSELDWLSALPHTSLGLFIDAQPDPLGQSMNVHHEQLTSSYTVHPGVARYIA